MSKNSDGIQGNNNSQNHDLTPDGHYSAFSSTADNLVTNDTNGVRDIFVHDRTTGITERVSVSSDGTQADDWSYDASLSADGRYVAFYSRANNLISGEQTYFSQVYVHDRFNLTTERVSIATDGTLANQTSNGINISADGRFVGFSSSATNLDLSDDVNGTITDVYVHDRLNGVT